MLLCLWTRSHGSLPACCVPICCALKLKVTSLTVWCRMLRETPLYAILSGFPFGDTPGVGTFYDFFSRIWQNDSNNLSPRKTVSLNCEKATAKGEKAKVKKLPVILPVPHPNSFLCWNIGNSNRKIRFPLFSVSISSSSWSVLFRKD